MIEQSGCEFMKCEYAHRDMNNEPACSYEGQECRYKSIEEDEIQEAIDKLKADHEAAMKEKEREIAASALREAMLRDKWTKENLDLSMANADLLKKLEEARGEIEELREVNRVSADLLILNKQELADLRAKLAAAEKRLKTIDNTLNLAAEGRLDEVLPKALKEADHAD